MPMQVDAFVQPGAAQKLHPPFDLGQGYLPLPLKRGMGLGHEYGDGQAEPDFLALGFWHRVLGGGVGAVGQLNDANDILVGL